MPAVVTTRWATERGRRSDVRAAYVPVLRGVHAVVGSDLQDPDLRTAAVLAATPPGATLGGWAAARWHERAALAGRGRVDDALELDGLLPSGAPQPVLVILPPGSRLSAVPGRAVVRARLDPGERQDVDGGGSVTAPLRTAFDVARASTRETAVVVLDRMRALGLVTADALGDEVERRAGWRGVRAARRAVELSADGVQSPQETRLRLLWVATGLPVPRCNAVLREPDGRFVARVDLLDPVSGLVGEYDGSTHASAARRSADARRQERLEALGLVVVRASAADLATPTARARWQARLATAHRRALRRGSARSWRSEPGDHDGPWPDVPAWPR